MQTENQRQTLERILRNNNQLNIADVKHVLIMHEEELSNIGDWVIRFDYLKYLKGFLPNADITINLTVQSTYTMANALLKSNPHLHAITGMKWEDIDFVKYDFIIALSYDEPAILSWLDERYGSLIRNGQFNICVFTMSHYMIKQKEGIAHLFPVNRELGIYADKMKTPVEMFVSKQEQQWADGWLKENGLEDHEQLFIVLDATGREKMLTMPVYFEWLMDLLKRENIKVLNYDEMNIGKEQFYNQLLGDKLMSKFIFSKGLSLRQAICLLGSSKTRLVFGPTTGLMHCASGIYNNYVSNGLGKAAIPVLITYTGLYSPDEVNVNLWWGNNPLMNVLVLRNRNGIKTMLLLDDLDDVEKVTNDELPCSEYTARMLADFVNQKLPCSVPLSKPDIKANEQV
jgi:hypothetical protein